MVLVKPVQPSFPSSVTLSNRCPCGHRHPRNVKACVVSLKGKERPKTVPLEEQRGEGCCELLYFSVFEFDLSMYTRSLTLRGQRMMHDDLRMTWRVKRIRLPRLNFTMPCIRHGLDVCRAKHICVDTTNCVIISAARARKRMQRNQTKMCA